MKIRDPRLRKIMRFLMTIDPWMRGSLVMPLFRLATFDVYTTQQVLTINAFTYTGRVMHRRTLSQEFCGLFPDSQDLGSLESPHMGTPATLGSMQYYIVITGHYRPQVRFAE